MNWNADPGHTPPMTRESLKAAWDRVANMPPPAPRPKIVNRERYIALRDLHKLNASGDYCVNCEMPYFAASLKECRLSSGPSTSKE